MTTARIATVISAGRESGSSTRQKKPNREQPSIAAASSSSTGTARMNGRRITIVSGSPNAASGSATPSGDVEQAELADQEVQRQDRHGDREQQPEREEHVERLAAAEPVAGQRERRHRAERRRPGRWRSPAITALLQELAPERVVESATSRVVRADPGVGDGRPAGRRSARWCGTRRARRRSAAPSRSPPAAARRRRRRGRERAPEPTRLDGVTATRSPDHPRQRALGVAPQHEALVQQRDDERDRRTGSPRPRCRSRTRSGGSRGRSCTSPSCSRRPPARRR